MRQLISIEYQPFRNLTNLLFWLVVLFSMILFGCKKSTEKIAIPDDAPLSLSPKEAKKSFELPPEFRIELVANEPLISSPTGMCWDAKGGLYITELHGFNLPGQKEVEAMNKTGKIDTVVQRVEAADKYKEAAKPGIYGVVKRLSDTEDDGKMDKTDILANNLPPIYGCTAARDGLIVAGQTEVLYIDIADRNHNSNTEIVDTLFTGWKSNGYKDFRPERGISGPQWGPEGKWIYFNRGTGGGLITGPHLKQPVQLQRTSFRIRADGSAIEGVTGGAGTIGQTMTAEGYWIYAYQHFTYGIPIRWKYLKRNPTVSVSPLVVRGSDYTTVYPIAPTHPWRRFRSNNPEWRDYYIEHAGEEEVKSSNFTGACCPMIYRPDSMFPSAFHGDLFVSSPPHNLIHRASVKLDGPELKVHRGPESTDKKEFIRSSDSWFSPTGIAQAPDGSIYIADFYREIIEDYSAVPRPMQQKYRLNHGSDMGRIWRVSPVTAKPLDSVKQVDMSKANLDKELDSPHYWRRKTAVRLLYEQQGDRAPALVKQRLKLAELRSNTSPHKFISTLRRADTTLKTDVVTARKLVKMSQDITNESKLLQLALSLGYSRDTKVFKTLINFARKHANIRWMPDALMTGVNGRAEIMFGELIRNPGPTGQRMIKPLAVNISANGDKVDIIAALDAIVKSKSIELQVTSLKGFNHSKMTTTSLKEEGKMYLNILLDSGDPAVRKQATLLALQFDITDSKRVDFIRSKAVKDISNSQLTTKKRLKAVNLLSKFPDRKVGKQLVDAWSTATPPIKRAILEALISHANRLSTLIEAISNEVIPTNYLGSSQRKQLLERADKNQRSRLKVLFSKEETMNSNKAAVLRPYMKALEGADVKKGLELFKTYCASCHQMKNIGQAVGPDLESVSSNSNKSLLRSILWPNEAIASNYEMYVVTTNDDEKYSGVLSNVSPNGVVLRQVGGNEQSFLNKNIKSINSSQTSLMPPFREALSPDEIANIVKWLKTL